MNEVVPMKYIRPFDTIGMEDVPLVGGKNASLGQMIQALTSEGIRVPQGFAITTDAYRYVLSYNNLTTELTLLLNQLNADDTLDKCQKIGKRIRSLISQAKLPDDLVTEIIQAYDALSVQYHVAACDVAVRSSATAEDLPNLSFAGQQETYLNVQGHQAVLTAVINCMASLFTDRALVYRKEQGFAHDQIALSVGVQKMVRADQACAGVMFTIDTETGYKDAIIINGSYGLAELVVKGTVIPDEFIIHKPTFSQGFASLIAKKLGDKSEKMKYKAAKTSTTCIVAVDVTEQKQFCLSDAEVFELARYGLTIETYYSDLKKSWAPMDIEWAKDGLDGLLYIVQARPETIHAQKEIEEIQIYELQDSDAVVLTKGQSIGQKIAVGKVRLVKDVSGIKEVQPGDVLVTHMTDPDWVPVMKKAAALITTRGGRTCHAAIVSRELGITALVGVADAFQVLSSKDLVTVDCSQGATGYVYKGAVSYATKTITLSDVPSIAERLMITCADPDTAFSVQRLPVCGVGLVRLEFIMNSIGVHPMACVFPESVTDPKVIDALCEKQGSYPDLKTYFVESIAQAIATIAAAFYPRKVIVRCSDFKTNEYRNLLGGTFFESSTEANPMLGFRGAVRYYDDRYKQAFALECKALSLVRKKMGLINVAVMLPFVRTVKEAKIVCDELSEFGLQKGVDGLEVWMMCEIPSNILLLDQIIAFFRFKIGSFFGLFHRFDHTGVKSRA